jgi:hypothetical protein
LFFHPRSETVRYDHKDPKNASENQAGTLHQKGYEHFRRKLFELSMAFDAAAVSHPNLLHQWVWGGYENMQVADWQAFIRANSRIDGDWQEWSVAPGGMRCARFHGFEDGLTEYHRLAERGYKFLQDLRAWLDGCAEAPAGIVLNLPEETGPHGWTEAIYLTARCYATAMLSERSGYWNVSGQGSGSEEDSWTTTEAGERYPDHPAYEELVHDVFHSSAEAIRLWLDPDQAVRIGDYLEPHRFVLPSSEPASPSGSVEDHVTAADTVRPVFTKAGELWVGRYLVKRFRQPAENQRVVLASFQELEWCPHILDPITGVAGVEPKRRLRDTVDALNDHHKMPGLIRFGADGTGTGFIWCFGDRAPDILGVRLPEE